MRVLAITAVAGLVLLAGCDNQTDASPPPTTEDALTTATVAPTTPDDADVTSEEPAAVEPTTEEPTTQEPADDGPPEMPAEAQEQTEAGAEAFALHYLELINYTGMHPEVGILEPFGATACKSCESYEESVAYNVDHGDYLAQDTFALGTASTVFTDDSGRVAIPVEQLAQAFLRNGEETERTVNRAEANLIVRVIWETEGWLVSEITVEQ